jgi:hypothetical protein
VLLEVCGRAKTPGIFPALIAADEASGLCGADSRSCCAALQRSPLIFAETAPDTMILTSFQRPLQACVPDVASPTDLLGLFYLEEGRAGIPDWEEQLRILIQAGGLVAPIHGVTLLTGSSGSLAEDPAGRGSHESSTLSLDPRPPRLSSIDRQYKTFERLVPHISIQLLSAGSLQPVVPPPIASKHTS